MLWLRLAFAVTPEGGAEGTRAVLSAPGVCRCCPHGSHPGVPFLASGGVDETMTGIVAVLFCATLALVVALVSIVRLRRQVGWLRGQLMPSDDMVDTTTDAVTGLPNRSGLAHALGYARNRFSDLPGDVGVVALDLVGLGALNNSLGHDAGDLVLVEIAARLRDRARAHETLARVGGDRFVVLLEAPVTRYSGLRAAGRLMEAIAEPFEVGGVEVALRAHGGVAMGERVEWPQLIDDANVAVTRARAEGSRHPLVFEEVHKQDATDAFHQVQQLRTALSAGEFDVVYQPIHRYRDGHMTSVEALLRWNSPALGSVSPADFIPLAEDSGAIVEIGAWVLDRACEDLARLSLATGDHDLAVSVNVSAHQLRRPGFACTVNDALRHHGIEPQRLHLEITESTLALPEEVGEEIRAVDEIGVQIALDDVGTGYSSLAQLAEFPIETIKLDRSLIQAVDRGLDGAMSILRSLASLGRSLSLDVVVEGVETDAQSAIASRCGCTHEQGFLRSRPLPLEELLAYAERVDAPAAIHVVSGD